VWALCDKQTNRGTRGVKLDATMHWRNFTLKSGGDQWRRQDSVSGGHNDRGAEGASIEAPKAASGVRYGEGCPLPSRLGGLGERRELPQRGPGRSPGRYRIFCRF